MVSCLAGHTDKGHLAQATLHHPLEVAVEIAIDQENVECTLMVAHKDIRLALFEMLASLHMHRQPEHGDYDTRPQMGWPVTPEMSVAYQAARYGD